MQCSAAVAGFMGTWSKPTTPSQPGQWFSCRHTAFERELQKLEWKLTSPEISYESPLAVRQLAPVSKSSPARMALLRAATDQLLSAKSAPWMQRGRRIISRSFAAQAEPAEEDDGAYVVTARTVRVLLSSTGPLL